MTNLYPSETGRIDRLPTWAKDLVARLDRDLDDALEARDEALGALTMSADDVMAGTVQAYRVPHRKYLYVGERWTNDLRARFENANRLEITANGPLQIDVTASNKVEISERRL